MKKILLSLLIVASLFAKGEEQIIYDYFMSGNEKTAKDVLWENSTLMIGVFNNGKNRDGYASYACMVLHDQDKIGIFKKYNSVNIFIKDIRNMKTLGVNFCKK